MKILLDIFYAVCVIDASVVFWLWLGTKARERYSAKCRKRLEDATVSIVYSPVSRSESIAAYDARCLRDMGIRS